MSLAATTKRCQNDARHFAESVAPNLLYMKNEVATKTTGSAGAFRKNNETVFKEFSSEQTRQINKLSKSSSQTVDIW